MKEITQEEFEQYITDMLKEGKTRSQMKDELQTSYRTFGKRVQALSATNPALYQQYIEKYPYKPKSRRDINIIEIGIEYLKDKMTMEELARTFEVSERTIRRRLNGLKKSDIPEEKELYQLCSIVADNHSRYLPKSEQLELKIADLIQRLGMTENKPQKIDNVDIRRQELLEIEKQYMELCKTMSGAEAARRMGVRKEVIYKQLNELYCIEIERNARQKNKEFRERMAVNPKELNERTPEPTHKEQTELEKE